MSHQKNDMHQNKKTKDNTIQNKETKAIDRWVEVALFMTMYMVYSMAVMDRCGSMENRWIRIQTTII